MTLSCLISGKILSYPIIQIGLYTDHESFKLGEQGNEFYSWLSSDSFSFGDPVALIIKNPHSSPSFFHKSKWLENKSSDFQTLNIDFPLNQKINSNLRVLNIHLKVEGINNSGVGEEYKLIENVLTCYY